MLMMSYVYKDFDSIFEIILLLGVIRYASHHTPFTHSVIFAFTFHSIHTYTHTHIRVKCVASMYMVKLLIVIESEFSCMLFN